MCIGDRQWGVSGMCRPIVKAVGLGTVIGRVVETLRRRQKAGVEAGIAESVQAAPGEGGVVSELGVRHLEIQSVEAENGAGQSVAPEVAREVIRQGRAPASHCREKSPPASCSVGRVALAIRAA